MRKALLASVTGTALFSFGGAAFADSLTPSACPGPCTGFSPSVAVGGTTHITNKIGVITAGGPTGAQADVLFISDTTGSMSGPISSVRTAFGDVVTNLAGSISNLGTGAGQFKDKFTDGYDPFDYNLDQDITSNSALTQTAINTWSAAGGGDNPEQGLYALSQAATTTGWRAGSKRIAVITSDVGQHEGAQAPGGVTVASVAGDLVAAGVTVLSLNAGNMNAYGQFDGAGSIYDSGVAGSYTTPFPSSGDLASTLAALIGSSFATYSDVDLVLIGSSGPCSISLPTGFSGSFDRSTTNTFNFGSVDITGTGVGTCTFTIALEADGAILATETDTVQVGAVPEPASLAVFGAGLIGLGGVLRRRMRRQG